MSEILTDYLINAQTSILLPAKQIDYDTIAFEGQREFQIRKPAIKLIEEACLMYGSTFDGRRKAVMHHTNYKRRVPFPISISRDIYVFPTHAITDYECAWVFLKPIQFTKRMTRKKQQDGKKTMIGFHNNLGLILDVSHHTIEKQIERAEICRSIFMENIQVR